MQEQTYRRVDVGVTLKVSPEGNVRPLTITFENGKTYTIDRLKESGPQQPKSAEPASDILSLSKTVKTGSSGLRLFPVFALIPTFTCSSGLALSILRKRRS